VFDISFSELLVIAFVALVVIGPEKLPKVARTAGAFFGRLQRFVAQVKDEVNRESRFAELQKLQDEVHSSLQQSYVDIERSIMPTDTQELAPPPETVAKKTRKPRQAKVQVDTQQTTADSPAEPPKRRAKVAAEQDATAADMAQSTPAAEAAAPATKRQRKPKPKPGSDTPDMFVDEPHS
jgi:sec-independent protein translocase protein TatB